MNFAEIHNTYGSMIHRIASSFAEGEDRNDLEHEILVAVYEAAKRFRGEASSKTYIYRIAQNCCVNHLRKRRETEVFDEQSASNFSPEDVVAERQSFERLSAAIRTLPLPLRQPIVLRLEGCDLDEISEILGISTNNVSVRIHRATEQLKTMMNDE